MRRAIGAIATAALALSACGQAEKQQSAPNAGKPVNAGPSEVLAPIPPPGTGPDARTPFGEPRGAIDPRSVEAAAQIVQNYANLMEHRHFADAAKLWSNEDTATSFADQLNPEVHVEIGKLGETEGAAGSIYTTVPVVFFGDTYSKPANVILRRVNDVPGSSEAQRRWHIERIEWKAGG